MSTRQSFKRKYCPLSCSEVNVNVVSQGDYRDEDSDIEAIIKSSRGDSPENEKMRISDMISYLEEVQLESGDLILCVADNDSLFTISKDNLIFNLESRQNYDFTVGLNEEKYLSLKIE